MRRMAVIAIVALLIGSTLSFGPISIDDLAPRPGDGTPSQNAAQDTPATATPSPAVNGSARRTRLQFQEVAVERGFGYTYDQEFEGQMETLSNAGVYASDYDNDGWTDLLAIGGGRPVLFRNERGSFRRSGALPRVNQTVRGALFLDYDRDGWDDLLLLASNRTPLLLENTGGQFAVADAGFDRRLGLPVGGTVGDYDRDGCPDLFVIQYGDWFQEQPVGILNNTVPPGTDNGDPNVLYDGECSSFERVRDAGVAGYRWSLATSFVDLTGDGRVDIHVANDFNNDVVYVNRGNGTFDARVLDDATNRNAMSSEVADVNHDGRPDIFVTNVWFPEWFSEKLGTTMGQRDKGNNLLVNRNGSFADRAGRYGVRRGGWGWAATMADFDNDMDRDLFHTTSWIQFTAQDTELSPMEAFRFQMKHPYYHYPVLGERNETGFTRPVAPSDLGLRASGGRGVARLDFDRDGDQDLVVANSSRNGSYLLYENTLDRGSAVELRVVTNDGRRALGARVAVVAGDRVQRRWVTAQSDYLSQESRARHVGTGDRARADIRVVWPDGRTRTFEGVATDRRLVLAPDGIRRSSPLNGTAA